MAKLKNILQEVLEDSPKVDKHKVIEGVRNYGIVGKTLYNNNSIMEVAKQLAEIAESAHHHILGENDDWFDKISVNKNMKTLKGSVVEFQKTAKEAHQLNQRLTGLYEDIGHVLNRYYDIDEALDPVGQADGDIDNDGDEDESDEYLRKRRKYVIVIIFAVAALLTPPDPITQIGLGIPLLILYELSIFSVSLIEKKKNDARFKDN